MEVKPELELFDKASLFLYVYSLSDEDLVVATSEYLHVLLKKHKELNGVT